MKKNTRRALSLCLAVVLVLSVAVVASASNTESISFANVTGAYTITMFKSGSNNKQIAISDAPTYSHSHGYRTPIQATGYYSVTHTLWLPSPYEEPLETLFKRFGLQKSCTKVVNVGNTIYYVASDRNSGTYALGVEFKCYDTLWRLELVEPYSGTADPGRSELTESVPNGVATIKPVMVS